LAAFSPTFVKLLTPDPPVQVQFVFQEIVDPDWEIREAQSEPDWALESPHWSRYRVYGEETTLSHWPGWVERNNIN
jgi:hypothetical protein